MHLTLSWCGEARSAVGMSPQQRRLPLGADRTRRFFESVFAVTEWRPLAYSASEFAVY